MDAYNLSIMFGPALVRPHDDDMVTMVKDMSDQCQIVESLIRHVSNILLFLMSCRSVYSHINTITTIRNSNNNNKKKKKKKNNNNNNKARIISSETNS